jgi:hypothetical protein
MLTAWGGHAFHVDRIVYPGGKMVPFQEIIEPEIRRERCLLREVREGMLWLAVNMP